MLDLVFVQGQRVRGLDPVLLPIGREVEAMLQDESGDRVFRDDGEVVAD